MFRAADGLSETVATEIGSDVGWYALNIGAEGYSWDDYATLRSTAAANEVLCMPWARLYDPDDLFGLMWQAEQTGGFALLNIENEFQTDLPPLAVRAVVDEFPEVTVGISTLAWLQNDVDFEPLGHLPFLLQIFPQDAGWTPEELPQRERDCVWHAREKGVTYVGTTIQTYGEAVPEWFAYQDHVRSYYTGDDIGQGGWSDWKP